MWKARRGGEARMSDSEEGESALGNEYLRVRPNKNIRLVLIQCRWLNNEQTRTETEILRERPKLGAEAPCYRPVKNGRQGGIKGATAKAWSDLILR